MEYARRLQRKQIISHHAWDILRILNGWLEVIQFVSRSFIFIIQFANDRIKCGIRIWYSKFWTY